MSFVEARPKLFFERSETAELQFAWGDLVFAPYGASLQSMQLALAHNWAVLSRMGRKAAVQYVGTAPETVRVEGVIYLLSAPGAARDNASPQGFKALDALRAAGRDTQPRTLTDTTGRTWGRYALAGMTIGVTRMTADGSELREATFSAEFVQAPAERAAVYTEDENREAVQ